MKNCPGQRVCTTIPTHIWQRVKLIPILILMSLAQLYLVHRVGCMHIDIAYLVDDPRHGLAWQTWSARSLSTAIEIDIKTSHHTVERIELSSSMKKHTVVIPTINMCILIPITHSGSGSAGGPAAAGEAAVTSFSCTEFWIEESLTESSSTGGGGDRETTSSGVVSTGSSPSVLDEWSLFPESMVLLETLVESS